MNGFSVLWADPRDARENSGLRRDLSDHMQIESVMDADEVGRRLRRAQPNMACFEYDYPNRKNLGLIPQTKRRFPLLPLIMITEYHSEALAVWALRNRVWDYLVKPIPSSEMLTRLKLLAGLVETDRTEVVRKIVMPYCTVPKELCHAAKPRDTSAAVGYIEACYQEKICEREAAQLCKMGISTFSRAFRQDHGVPFREYIVRFRVEKAKELLHHPAASVTDVAFAVGFNDLSCFARIFRRYEGINPGRYLLREKTNKSGPPRFGSAQLRAEGCFPRRLAAKQS